MRSQDVAQPVHDFLAKEEMARDAYHRRGRGQNGFGRTPHDIALGNLAVHG